MINDQGEVSSNRALVHNSSIYKSNKPPILSARQKVHRNAIINETELQQLNSSDVKLNNMKRNRKSLRADLMAKNAKKKFGFIKDLYHTIRELRIKPQICIYYSFFMLWFVLIICFAKIVQINALLESQTDNNYYISIVKETLERQRKAKNILDGINDNNFSSGLFNELLFLRIFNQELVHKKLIDIRTNSGDAPVFAFNQDTFPTELDSYKDISKSFILTSDIKRLIDYDSPKGDLYYINSLFPFWYEFIPIIFQTMKLRGIPLINMYFLGYDPSDCSSSSFFKYPTDIENPLIPSIISNKIPDDYIIEPIGSCFLNLINFDPGTPPDLPDKIKRTNWYYNWEKQFLNDDIDPLKKHNFKSKMLTIKKVADYPNSEYFLNFINFKHELNPQTNWYFTLSMRMSKTNITLPFIKYGFNKDLDKYHWFAMINFKTKHESVEINHEDNIYEWDYNIDDNNALLINYPTFVDNIYKYATIPKQANIDYINTVNLDSWMLNYTQFSKISTDYNVNHYYMQDIHYFKWVLFLNKFLYYYHNYGHSTENNHAQTEDNHPCNVDDIDKYYEEVSQFKDCLADFCFFNSCNLTSVWYTRPEKSRFMPDCYCLPWYCRDELSDNNSKFHKWLTSKLNLDITDNSYSFNSERGYIELDNSYFDKMSNTYYDKDKNSFSCRINFTQKDQGWNDQSKAIQSFNALITFNSMAYDRNTTSFVMFFMANSEIEDLIAIFKSYVNQTKWIIYGLYFVLLLACSIYLIYHILQQLQLLTDRILELKGIRVDIIRGKTDISWNKLNSVEMKPWQDNEKEKLLQNGQEQETVKQQGNKPTSQGKWSKNIKNEEHSKNDFCVDNAQDEWSELKNLIINNIKDFKIEFNTSHFSKGSDSSDFINKQYEEINFVNSFIRRWLPKEKKRTATLWKPIWLQSNDDDLLKSNYTVKSEDNQSSKGIRTERQVAAVSNTVTSSGISSSSSSSSEAILSVVQDDLSLVIFNELYSWTTAYIDFRKIKTNCLFKEKSAHSWICLDEVIWHLNWDEHDSNEIFNKMKIDNSIDYYIDNIRNIWKRRYDLENNGK